MRAIAACNATRVKYFYDTGYAVPMIAALGRFLSGAGTWALVPIFLVVMLESSAFLGVLFPGEAVALIAGALAATGAFSPWYAFAAVAGGAVLGDIGGYALGRYWGQVALSRWSFARRQYDRHRSRFESYFKRWGIATVLFGRFVAVGRAFVPFAAGLLKMRASRFIPWPYSPVGLGAESSLLSDMCWARTGD